ncbi:MAG: hypothetical protein ACOX6L_02415 [Syntrophomonadaceae bacterium]|jgi:hypothetical protein
MPFGDGTGPANQVVGRGRMGGNVRGNSGRGQGMGIKKGGRSCRCRQIVDNVSDADIYSGYSKNNGRGMGRRGIFADY